MRKASVALVAAAAVCGSCAVAPSKPEPRRLSPAVLASTPIWVDPNVPMSGPELEKFKDFDRQAHRELSRALLDAGASVREQML